MSLWRSIAILMKAQTFAAETQVDLLVTNAVTNKARADIVSGSIGMILRTRQCRLLKLGNINSAPTGVDMNR